MRPAEAGLCRALEITEDLALSLREKVTPAGFQTAPGGSPDRIREETLPGTQVTQGCEGTGRGHPRTFWPVGPADTHTWSYTEVPKTRPLGASGVHDCTLTRWLFWPPRGPKGSSSPSVAGGPWCCGGSGGGQSYR